MKRTRPTTLITLVLIGGVAGFLVQLILAAASQPKLRPEYTLAITLLFIAVLVVALAVPVRRATRAAVRRHIDPFYATRVVVLAKASSLGGALLTGVAAGFLLELLVRCGIPLDRQLRAGDRDPRRGRRAARRGSRSPSTCARCRRTTTKAFERLGGESSPR